MPACPHKQRVQISDIAAKVESGADLILESENIYSDRLFDLAETVIRRGAKILLLTGPSGSGKTTTALRLAQVLRRFGTPATVVTMDEFYKNKEDYPLLPDGRLDFENVNSLDLAEFQRAVNSLVETGSYMMPRYDFSKGCREPERQLLTADKDSVFIAEGIHSLNPLVSDKLPQHLVMRVYATLMDEYYDGDELKLGTKHLRIIRRGIRDRDFRAYSIENTLSIWDNILDGENRYIKPYRHLADYEFNTSFESEVPLFAARLRELLRDEREGGAHRATLMAIAENYFSVPALSEEGLPKNSVMREFLGGIEL